MGIPFPGQTSGLGQQPRPYLWRLATARAFAIAPLTYQTTSKFKQFPHPVLIGVEWNATFSPAIALLPGCCWRR
jgi:hypothetical protein